MSGSLLFSSLFAFLTLFLPLMRASSSHVTPAILLCYLFFLLPSLFPFSSFCKNYTCTRFSINQVNSVRLLYNKLKHALTPTLSLHLLLVFSWIHLVFLCVALTTLTWLLLDFLVLDAACGLSSNKKENLAFLHPHTSESRCIFCLLQPFIRVYHDFFKQTN